MSPQSGPISGLPDIDGLTFLSEWPAERSARQLPEHSTDGPFAEKSPVHWSMDPVREPLPVPAAPARRRVSDTELHVSPLALGASVFGWTLGAQASHDVLNRYAELGGNFIDTADSYSAGRSEHLIGTWMRTQANRDDVVLSTKIGRGADFQGLGAAGISRAVEASLERLQTDHIDLLAFHFDDQDVQLEESLGAVDALITSGKVRYLAAANFTAGRLLEARVLAANGLPRFRVMQAHYNLLHRAEYESSLALVARAQGLAVMPHFALANGFLAGSYRSRAAIAPSTRGGRVAAHLTRRGARVLAIMDRIADEHAVALPTIAIAWLQAQSSVCAPVVGVSSTEQLDAVMAASDFRLNRSDSIELDRATASR